MSRCNSHFVNPVTITMTSWWSLIGQPSARSDGWDDVTKPFAVNYFDSKITNNIADFRPTVKDPKFSDDWKVYTGQINLCNALQLAVEYADDLSESEKRDIYAEVLFLAAAEGITHYFQATMADAVYVAFEATCDTFGLQDLLRYELRGDSAKKRSRGEELVRLFYQHVVTSRCLWGKIVSYIYVPMLRREMKPTVTSFELAEKVVCYMKDFEKLEPRVFAVLRDKDGALMDISTTIGMKRRYMGIFARLRFSSTHKFYQHREMEFRLHRHEKHEDDVPAGTPPLPLLPAEPRVQSSAFYLEAKPKIVAPCMRCGLVFNYFFPELAEGGIAKDDRPSLFEVAACAEIEGCRFLMSHMVAPVLKAEAAGPEPKPTGPEDASPLEDSHVDSEPQSNTPGSAGDRTPAHGRFWHVAVRWLSRAAKLLTLMIILDAGRRSVNAPQKRIAHGHSRGKSLRDKFRRGR